MIVLQAADVRKALPMDETITAMKRAFAALSGGRARMPLRIRLEIPLYEGESMFMPVGVAVQDAAAARLALHNAQALGIGQQVKW
jgi:ornithine cyclodeaminase/alanine dehydrogenase-like protein (mu-crystallin family)